MINYQPMLAASEASGEQERNAMLHEWHLVDATNDEWYCTILNEQDVTYWLNVYRHLYPSVVFEVQPKVYGVAA